jgi:hypothetical protein
MSEGKAMTYQIRAKNNAARRSWFWIALVFLISRIIIWSFPRTASDVGIYSTYAREQIAADRAGVSFYAYHARVMEQQAQTAHADARPVEEYQNIEYPPLTLAFLRLPTLVMMFGSAEELPESVFEERYQLAYHAGLAVLDTSLFAILIGLVSRLFPGETGSEHRQRLWSYVLTTSALWYLLFDRLDLVMALLVLLALVLLISRVHFGCSFGLLALAIHFKLVPLVLAPIFLVGSLPTAKGFVRSKPRLVAALAVRTALLALLIVLILLPYYVVHGTSCLGFLAYHQTRGLEFESLYGSLLLLLQKWTGPVEVAYSFKSVTFQSSLSPLLIRIAPWVAVGLLAATAVVLLVHFSLLLARNPAERNATTTLAQRFPQLVVGYSLLFLMLFIATNKVFSPQYLLWLIPLVVLVPLGGKARGIFLWSFLLTCVLSTVLFPFLFMKDLVAEGSSKLPVALWKFIAPSARLTAILVLRNTLFVGLLVSLAGYLLRCMRTSRDSAGE